MFKGPHFEQSVISLCVRWYLSYGLSLRDLKEIMAERGIGVDHSTIHRWVVHFAPLLADRFNRRKRAVTGRWHADETYVKVRDRWTYLYRAIDSNGDTVEFRPSNACTPVSAASLLTLSPSISRRSSLSFARIPLSIICTGPTKLFSVRM